MPENQQNCGGRRDTENYEELRIALVMNGGVSLAIWIGGVAQEINRLVHEEGVYGKLLEATETKPRVDVISGASAGGINGAILSLAQVYRADISSLRDIWLDKAAFGSLLRDPLSKDIPSLLNGDNYFLKELEAAFRNVVKEREPQPAADVPIDLTMTATLLHGRACCMSDDLGTVIVDADHRARFHFQRGPDVGGDDPDPFKDREDIVKKLARAARATASFPVAFEPVFWPVVKKNKEGKVLPDGMKGLVTVSGEPQPKDRFLLDGGILDNKPIESALDAIFAQRADRDVRRVLAYVVPDPGESAQNEDDKKETPPALAEVGLASLITLPHHEMISDQLNQIREHNLSVERQRQTRMTLLLKLEPEKIDELAETLFQTYRAHRIESAVAYIVREVDEGVRRSVENSRGLGRNARGLLAAKLKEKELRSWIPMASPESSEFRVETTKEKWSWGLYSVEFFAHVMLDVLRRAQRLAGASTESTRGNLKELRQQAYDLLADVIRLRRQGTEEWRISGEGLCAASGKDQSVPRLDMQKVQEWATTVISSQEAKKYKFLKQEGSIEPEKGTPRPGEVIMQEARGWLAHQIAAIIFRAAPVMGSIVQAALNEPSDAEKHEAEELRRYVDFFVRVRSNDYTGVLSRLLALDIVTYAIGDHRQVTDQNVELVQISANTPSAFGGRDKAGEKLAGVKLGHFGAFYKKSWRANDWMFGRLDGAMRLVQIVLNPSRLRKLYGKRDEADQSRLGSSGTWEKVIKPLAFWQDGEIQNVLKDYLSEEAAKEELDFLDDQNKPLPDFLPVCAAAVAGRLQLGILREELPGIARAVEHDQQDGSDRILIPGVRFLDEMKSRREIPGSDKLKYEEVIHLFESCRIAEEQLREEVGSDLLTKTVSKALAVTVSAASAPKSGLGLLRGLLALIRAPVLLFYFMAQNLDRSSRTSAALNATLISVGATLTGLVIFGVVSQSDMPTFLLSAGVVLLSAGLLLALVRRPAICVIVLAAVVAGLLWWTWSSNSLANLWSVGKKLFPVLILAVVMVILAIFRRPRWLDRFLLRLPKDPEELRSKSERIMRKFRDRISRSESKATNGAATEK